MNPAALIGVVVCGLLGACGASAEPAADQAGAAITAEANKAASCRWQPMAVGGGGFNMSQEIAPGARTRVIRTDSYGAYRWENNRWVQLHIHVDAARKRGARPQHRWGPAVGGGRCGRLPGRHRRHIEPTDLGHPVARYRTARGQ